MAITLSKESLNREQATEKAAQAMVKLQDMQLGRKLGTMLMIALAVAAGLYVFFWSQKPDYSPLYTGLDPKATAEATDLCARPTSRSSSTRPPARSRSRRPTCTTPG